MKLNVSPIAGDFNIHSRFLAKFDCKCNVGHQPNERRQQAEPVTQRSLSASHKPRNGANNKNYLTPVGRQPNERRRQAAPFRKPRCSNRHDDRAMMTPGESGAK